MSQFYLNSIRKRAFSLAAYKDRAAIPFACLSLQIVHPYVADRLRRFVRRIPTRATNSYFKNTIEGKRCKVFSATIRITQHPLACRFLTVYAAIYNIVFANDIMLIPHWTSFPTGTVFCQTHHPAFPTPQLATAFCKHSCASDRHILQNMGFFCTTL